MKKIPDLPKAFGKVISDARSQQGISQEKLAEAIGSTNVYISMLENGQRQPSLNAALLIAKELDMKPEELVSKLSELLQGK